TDDLYRQNHDGECDQRLFSVHLASVDKTLPSQVGADDRHRNGKPNQASDPGRRPHFLIPLPRQCGPYLTKKSANGYRGRHQGDDIGGVNYGETDGKHPPSLGGRSARVVRRSCR
ncbi:MAG TPA: hypothetical protein VN179_09405, partial [Solirubrobacterales bacterium]|nr:hypothetical protein [Solirubrobacterales bacterium]